MYCIKTYQKELLNNNKKLIAISKLTNEMFDDGFNKSGKLTNHLIENKIFNSIDEIEPKHKRLKLYKTTGKFWYDEWFILKEVDLIKKETRKCPYCEWETIDIENKTGVFEQHIKEKHNISLEEHIKNYPNDIKFHKTFLLKKEKDEFLKENNNYVICKICNEKFKTLTTSHLKKHNITHTEYKIKYENKVISNSLKTKYSENMIELNKVLKQNFQSKGELEIINFLKEKGVYDITTGNKNIFNGVEIDIFSKEKGIAIEYNGLAWHSENFGKKDLNFHLNKTNIVNSKNYKLIHIFEDEWNNKKEIVKSKLLNLFGKNNNPIIGARKCEIKEINSDIKNMFLEKNHIQGGDKSKIKYGAYFNDKLIAVMCFDTNINSKLNNNIWELSRFAIDINYRVPGIAGKMIKKFINDFKPNKIISFADRRWTLDKDNNLYINLGFKLTKILKPDYRYVDSNFKKRIHKTNFRKQKIIKLFNNVDIKKTEREIMQENNYDRIWDCGLFKYELII